MTMMDKRLAQWFASGDTGISSEAVALWMSAGVKLDRWGSSTPSDGGDFGRCYRLLKLFPEWRERIADMAGAGNLWPTYAARWADMEAAYEADLADKRKKGSSSTWDLMRVIHADAYEAAGYDVVRSSDGGVSSATLRTPTPQEPPHAGE